MSRASSGFHVYVKARHAEACYLSLQVNISSQATLGTTRFSASPR